MKRRTFLKSAAMGGALLLLAGKNWSAIADNRKLLDLTGRTKGQEAAVATAKAMQYVADAEAAEKAGKMKRPDKDAAGKKYPGKEQWCLNCQLYTQVNEASGGCAVIPGALVAAKGWCQTWGPKMG